MTEWRKVRLGDICEISAGGDRPQLVSDKETDICHVPIYSNGVDNDGLYGFTDKEKIKGDTITITARGANVGTVFYRKTAYYPIIRLLSLQPNEELVNSRYLYYLIKDKTFLSTGSAQPQITVPNISKYVIEYDPDVVVQRRIAEVLSRYDALIENYQRQIKLLEEAAQRLYKEWFVDLRFPGHQSTPIINGIPKGWERLSVDSIYSIKYGKNLSTKLISETGQFPVYGANGVIGYYKEANCNEQVVLITSRGNGSGDVLMTYHSDAFITNNSFIVTPNAEFSYCKLPFTFQFLRNANFRAVRTGAAQPQLTNQSIHTVVVTLPTRELITDYCRLTYDGNSMIIKLRNQIRNLSEARDRLLPKLMSAEIDV